MNPLDAGLTIADAVIHGPDPSGALVAHKCRALLHGYDARWRGSTYVITGCERFVESELWNPETGRRSRSFRLAGKIDMDAADGMRYIIVDHKTCSEDIADPNSPYWRQLVVEGQATHYMLLEWLNQRKVDGAVWDVLRKPTIGPKKLETKRDLNETLNTAHYFGQQISDASLCSLRETGRESYEMYEARLRWDCMENRPEWYFQRRSVVRLDADLQEWATELWGHSQDMLIARRESRWPRNSGACMNYGRPCDFLGICSGYDTPESDKWRRKRCVHNELAINGDGRDLLTISRIRCFQTCRRKHYYQYELGIERADAEEAESLYFGSLWHLMLEAYSNAMKGPNGSNSDDFRATEVRPVDETPVYF